MTTLAELKRRGVPPEIIAEFKQLQEEIARLKRPSENPSNADRIRAMEDEELNRFLFTWKINAIAGFLEKGGQGGTDAQEQLRWLKEHDWRIIQEVKPWE